VKVGGADLPTGTSDVPSGWIELGDTIAFISQAGAASGTVEHHETGHLSSMSPTTLVYERLYHWDGRVIRFYPPPCPPNALCGRATQETGILASGYLTITYADPTVRSRTYRRIS
jgi:hypothetical protein